MMKEEKTCSGCGVMYDESQLVHFDDAKKHSKVAHSRLPSGVSVGDRLKWDQNTFTQLL